MTTTPGAGEASCVHGLPHHRRPGGRPGAGRAPVRAADGDDARPAVPDGAGLRGPGEGAGALRVAGPGGRSRPPTPRSSPRCAPYPRRCTGSRARWRPGIQQLATIVVEEYDGHAERLWSEAGTGRELMRRLQALPGFGKQKAQIFTALLGKQLDVRPDGWEAAAGDYAEPGSHRSVADVVDQASLERVRVLQEGAEAGRRSPREMAAVPAPRGTPGDGVRLGIAQAPCHNGDAALDVNGPCRARQPLYER